LSNYGIGEAGGSESVTLAATEMPAHTHTIDASKLTATEQVSSGAGNQVSPSGNVLAVDAAAPFTNPSLTARSDVIRAAHITELRTRVDAARARFGLAAFSYTDPTITAGTTVVKAAHILELRTALEQAYVKAGLTPLPTYTDPVLTARATLVKSVHITEIRSAIDPVANVPLTYSSVPQDSTMHPVAVTLAGGTSQPTGGNQGHENRQPFLAMNYCIALNGVFPSQ
jgi:microcystin-dependent protein